MASLSTDPHGNRVIQFTADRKRKTVGLGKMSSKATATTQVSNLARRMKRKAN
jgi:hypothetical protein